MTCELKSVRPKKAAPVAKSSVGVTRAATPQPQICRGRGRGGGRGRDGIRLRPDLETVGRSVS